MMQLGCKKTLFPSAELHNFRNTLECHGVKVHNAREKEYFNKLRLFVIVKQCLMPNECSGKIAFDNIRGGYRIFPGGPELTKKIGDWCLTKNYLPPPPGHPPLEKCYGGYI